MFVPGHLLLPFPGTKEHRDKKIFLSRDVPSRGNPSMYLKYRLGCSLQIHILTVKNTTFRGLMFPMHFQCLLGIYIITVQGINGIFTCTFGNNFYVIETLLNQCENISKNTTSNFPFIDNLKKPACASKRNGLASPFLASTS